LAHKNWETDLNGVVVIVLQLYPPQLCFILVAEFVFTVWIEHGCPGKSHEIHVPCMSCPLEIGCTILGNLSNAHAGRELGMTLRYWGPSVSFNPQIATAEPWERFNNLILMEMRLKRLCQNICRHGCYALVTSVFRFTVSIHFQYLTSCSISKIWNVLLHICWHVWHPWIIWRQYDEHFCWSGSLIQAASLCPLYTLESTSQLKGQSKNR
jgi:hypothetical protein